MSVMRLSLKNFLKLVDGRMGKRRVGGHHGWWLRTQGIQRTVIYVEGSHFTIYPLEGGHVQSRYSRVTAAFSVRE